MAERPFAEHFSEVLRKPGGPRRLSAKLFCGSDPREGLSSAYIAADATTVGIGNRARSESGHYTKSRSYVQERDPAGHAGAFRSWQVPAG